MKEVIGSFTVTDRTLQQKTVIISQEVLLDRTGVIVETKRYLTLDSLNGEEVFRGEDENILTLADGSILKKSSNIRFGDPEKYTPVVRRSMRR